MNNIRLNVDVNGHEYEMDGLIAEVSRLLQARGQRLVVEDSDNPAKGPIYRLEN
jgi:hypothetical protein